MMRDVEGGSCDRERSEMGEQIDLLVRKLRDEGEALATRLAALPPKAWEMPIYGEGQVWMVRDVLAHLVSAERGHQRLIADVAAGGSGSPPDFSVDEYNRRHVAALAERSPADLLTDLRSVRTDTVALVSDLTDADLARRGNHPALGADTALVDFIRIIFMHGKMHLRDVTRALNS
jgi:uncharacterized protein (TIGR03083 family)